MNTKYSFLRSKISKRDTAYFVPKKYPNFERNIKYVYLSI